MQKPTFDLGEAMVTAKELSRLLAITRGSLYEMEADGRAPKAIRLGKKTLRWRRQEVLDWLEKLK